MRVLVSGAGSGIGKATAVVLASRGHEVVATARDEAALEGLEVAVRRRLDVADEASVDEIRRELGWVDVLVNNAAVSIGGPVEFVPMKHVREMFETNVFGPVRLIQAFVPGMRERRSGVVVNICSVAGHVAEPLGGYYRGHKARLGGDLRSAIHRARSFRGTGGHRRAGFRRSRHEASRVRRKLAGLP